MDLNLNYLRIFFAAAESKSLAEVCEKTGYEIANVSTTIKKFEEQLGVKLFTRNPLQLTEIGRDIYKIAKRGYRDMEFISVIAQSKNNMSEGKITIGCPLNLTKYYLMNCISKAEKDYPDLQVTIDCETNYSNTIQKISNNQINFAVLDFNPLDEDSKKDFVVKELYDCEYIFVSNEKKEIKNIEELNNYKFVTSEDYRYSTTKLRKNLSQYGIDLKQSVMCVMTEARIEATKLGLGIAYVLKEAVKKELEDGELFEVKMPMELPKTTINLIYIKDRLTKVDKQFIKNYL